MTAVGGTNRQAASVHRRGRLDGFEIVRRLLRQDRFLGGRDLVRRPCPLADVPIDVEDNAVFSVVGFAVGQPHLVFADADNPNEPIDRYRWGIPKIDCLHKFRHCNPLPVQPAGGSLQQNCDIQRQFGSFPHTTVTESDQAFVSRDRASTVGRYAQPIRPRFSACRSGSPVAQARGRSASMQPSALVNGRAAFPVRAA